MQTITFTCETITPMFLNGADGTTPELRAPSIKGALRFWWRAMNGHLTMEALKENESKLFGSPDEQFGRSKVIIQVKQQPFSPIQSPLVPHKDFMKAKAIPKNTRFEVVIRLTNNCGITQEQAKNLFILTALFGGFGKRSRRGMGSVAIVAIAENSAASAAFAMPTNLDDILKRINTVNDNFKKDKDRNNLPCITPKTSANEKYAHIKQIHIGRAQSGLELKISIATHDTMDDNPRSYGDAMGKVRGGRFSSPVYTSITRNPQKQTLPVIVTLNTVSDASNPRYDVTVQESFKSKIL